MTVRARAPALVLFAAAACLASTLAGAARPSAAALRARDACADALAYEKTAATDSVSRQAAYDSAVAGLTINQTCANPQQHLVNEAYLLSMRAAAAHDLNIGDWRRDLAYANTLLAQCAGAPGLARIKAGDDCRAQLLYNRRYEAALTAPSPNASQAPASAGRPPG